MESHGDHHQVSDSSEQKTGVFGRMLGALGGLIGVSQPSVRRGKPYYQVPAHPHTAPEPGVLRFFNPHEAQTVEALASRIVPMDENIPGAREAGVLNYIDYMLSQGDGFHQPIYRQPPFARAYEGDQPPEPTEGEQVIWVKKEELARYGFQSSLDPREIYRRGLASLDDYCHGRFGTDFVSLDEDRQDQIVQALVADEAVGFDEPSARSFFQIVEEHTIEGMFSDPQYGGNLDKVGWKAIGFPGAQRAYTPADMKNEAIDLAPQSLAELHAFHPRMPDHGHQHPAVATPMPLTPRQ